MKQWPSEQGAGLPNQRSEVQNHKLAKKLPQISSIKGQSMNIKSSWGLGG